MSVSWVNCVMRNVWCSTCTPVLEPNKLANEYVNCMSKCDINFSFPVWISRAGGIFVCIQKPLSIGQSLIQAQLLRVTQFSLLRTLQSVLWFYGLSLCGPFRTILITQHYDFSVITGVGALFSGRYSTSNILVTALCDVTPHLITTSYTKLNQFIILVPFVEKLCNDRYIVSFSF